jgi:probable F420-dependent oxidoreductase
VSDLPRPGWGLALPLFDSHRTGFAPLAKVARRAEALGYDSIWAGDHLFWHAPNIECLIGLAYVAGATEHITIGSGVLLPALRDPVVLSKQLASIDVVSGGRFIAGFGVGGEYLPEWEAQQVDVRTRGKRTDEVIDLWRSLSSGEPVDYEGRHYTLHAPGMTPVPERPVPLWIAGRAEASLKRAVRVGAGWLPGWISPRRIAAERERLAELAAEAGREPPAIGLLMFVYTGEATAGVKEARAFTEQHYNMPWENMERYAAVGPEDHVLERVEEYRAAGVEDFIFGTLGVNAEEQYERLAAVGERFRARTAAAALP